VVICRQLRPIARRASGPRLSGPGCSAFRANGSGRSLPKRQNRRCTAIRFRQAARPVT